MEDTQPAVACQRIGDKRRWARIVFGETSSLTKEDGQEETHPKNRSPGVASEMANTTPIHLRDSLALSQSSNAFFCASLMMPYTAAMSDRIVKNPNTQMSKVPSRGMMLFLDSVTCTRAYPRCACVHGKICRNKCQPEGRWRRNHRARTHCTVAISECSNRHAWASAPLTALRGCPLAPFLSEAPQLVPCWALEQPRWALLCPKRLARWC